MGAEKDYQMLLKGELRSGLTAALTQEGDSLRNVLDLALKSRTFWQCKSALDQALNGSSPQLVKEYSDAFQFTTMAANSKLLQGVTAIADVFEAQSIDYLVIKGPFFQQQLYNSYFVRPSGDLDILVQPKDARAAVRALSSIGFKPSEKMTLWWRVFLGQQHLVPSSGEARWSIDLHHRLQQPGYQTPQNTAQLFESPAQVEFSNRSVPVPQERFLPVISAIQLVKTLGRRRGSREVGWRVSSAVHAGDLHHALSSPDDIGRFIETASSLGLRGTALLALRGAHAVHGTDLGEWSETVQKIMPHLTDETLAMMLLCPEQVAEWPTTQDILRATCAGDTRSYLREIVRYTASESGRKLIRGARLMARALPPDEASKAKD